MFKNKKLASALLLTTFVAASVATTALAAGSGEPPQIPGYDRHGGTGAGTESGSVVKIASTRLGDLAN